MYCDHDNQEMDSVLLYTLVSTQRGLERTSSVVLPLLWGPCLLSEYLVWLQMLMRTTGVRRCTIFVMK